MRTCGIREIVPCGVLSRSVHCKAALCARINSHRASKMHDRAACQKTIRGRAVRFLKGGATIGAVRHWRDARLELARQTKRAWRA